MVDMMSDSRDIVECGPSSSSEGGAAGLNVFGAQYFFKPSKIRAHSFRLTSNMWTKSCIKLRIAHPLTLLGGRTT
jgi:hypothetical protein